jgi:hypothetical protein
MSVGTSRIVSPSSICGDQLNTKYWDSVPKTRSPLPGSHVPAPLQPDAGRESATTLPAYASPDAGGGRSFRAARSIAPRIELRPRPIAACCQEQRMPDACLLHSYFNSLYPHFSCSALWHEFLAASDPYTCLSPAPPAFPRGWLLSFSMCCPFRQLSSDSFNSSASPFP